MPITRHRTALFTAPLALLAFAACGSKSATSAASTVALGAATASTSPPATADVNALYPAAETTVAQGAYSRYGTPAATTAATGTAASIGTADTPLGKLLVDGAGFSLYVYAKDTPTTSACTGSCATNWPAVLSGAAPTLGAGLDAGDFVLVTRADSTKQLSFYGHLLYHFGGDLKAGDTNGRGVNPSWHLVDSGGNPVTK